MAKWAPEILNLKLIMKNFKLYYPLEILNFSIIEMRLIKILRKNADAHFVNP